MARGKYFPCLGDHCESPLFDDDLFELLTSYSWHSEPDKELADLKLRTNYTIYMDTVHFAILVHLEFDSKRETARAFESKLVESDMRIVFAIPVHREYMRSGYPSEPCLVEAAAKVLKQNDTPLQILCPKSLAEAIQSGFTA